MNSKRKSIFIINFLTTMMAVAPAFALGEGNRNILLIVVMAISPILLFLCPKITPRVDIPLFLVLSMMIGFPLLFHPETMRWSTLLYSCMFCLYFIGYCRILRSTHYEKEDFLKLLRFLIYAYCVVLVIQQFCVLTGLPIFNLSNYDPQTPWKLNSLTAEPSHSARIIPIIMYIYVLLTIKKGENIKDTIKRDRSLWIAFLWPILTMGSSTAFVFLFLIVIKFFNIKKLFNPLVIGAVAVAITVLLVVSDAFARMWEFAKVVYTLDEDLIFSTDSSAAFRILPSVLGFRFIGFSSLNDWIGFGVDADTVLITPLPSVEVGGAGAFTMWVNYGFITCMAYWITTYKLYHIKGEIVSVLIWLLCAFHYGGINSQIVWLPMFLIYTYKYVRRKNINSIKKA